MIDAAGTSTCRQGSSVSWCLITDPFVRACSSPQSPARGVATRFYAAVEAADWATACGLLAPETKHELVQSAGTRCPAALEDEDLAAAGPVTGFTGFGTMAQTAFEEDTVFVAEFEDGWKVMAAGCAPVAGHPYDFRLQG